MATIKVLTNGRPTFTASMLATGITPNRPRGGDIIRPVQGGATYLICEENANTPLKVSGCPNGLVRPFLVDLQTGYRVNLEHFDSGVELMWVEAEVVIKA